MIKLWQIIDMIRDERRRIEMAGFSGKHDLFDHRILVAMALGAARELDRIEEEQKTKRIAR